MTESNSYAICRSLRLIRIRCGVQVFRPYSIPWDVQEKKRGHSEWLLAAARLTRQENQNVSLS